MRSATLNVERADEVATLKLRRAFCLDVSGKQEITGAVRTLAQDPNLRALIITGEHPEAFLVDVSELVEMGPAEALAFSEAGYELANALAATPFPTVAAVGSPALGGGCEFVMACDLAYASSEATFGQIEVLGGVIPGFGGTWRLAERVGISRAMEMIFTAAILTADRAKELGLVLDVFPEADLLAQVQEVCLRISAAGQYGVTAAKQLLRGLAGPPSATAVSSEQATFASLFGQPEQQRRMRAFLAKRALVR